MQKKLASFIMPTYTASQKINVLIDSVLNQMYGNWELQVINDCSKDNTQDIISNIMSNDNCVKLGKQNKNKGVAESRNKSIYLAKGDYIAILGSDDMWPVDKLEKQIDLGFYRIMDGSLSSNKVRAARWQWNIYRSEMNYSLLKSSYYFINYLYQGVRKSR